MLPSFDMSGRVAVVTASTKGMGLAIAKAYAAAGAAVVVSGRDEARARDVAGTLGAAKATGLALDVTDAASVERFARRALDAFCRVDVLVGNAAADPPIGPLAKIDLAAFGPAMEANVRSNLVLVNALAPGMAERRDGAFVFTGSIVGKRGTPALGLYSITKAALEGLVRNLAVEWGRHGIRVNAIAPGFVRTEFSRPLLSNPEIEKRAVERTPLGRIAEAEDVAGLALLLGAPAGAFISGQVIGVDGGASAW